MVTVIKKDGTRENFNIEKIFSAVDKSAKRVNIEMDDAVRGEILLNVLRDKLTVSREAITVEELHSIVELSLDNVNPAIAKSYKDYRNYKKEFGIYLMDDIERQVNQILYDVDRENANSNTAYISTKRTEVAKAFSKELYQKTHLSTDVLQAMRDGYIYMHDLSDMILQQYNCSLMDIGAILKGGFELEHVKYTEPKDISVAIGQLGDIIMTISAQTFGGATTPEIDKILAPYLKKTFSKYVDEYFDVNEGVVDFDKAYAWAEKKAYRDLTQGLQGLEIKLNTVVSARGSFPFTTFTFGHIVSDPEDGHYQALVSKAILEVRMKGHGPEGQRKNLIFPKLVFLQDDAMHDDGRLYDWLFNLAVECSSKCMYPDFLGHGHKREGKFVSPMGCRAYLSNWYHNPEDKYDTGSQFPRDEKDEIVFAGRFNLGAISLNLPMIYMQSMEEDKDFYELLDGYLEMIRQIHLDRIEYVGKAKASSNPLMFCHGGALGGYLNPEDRIAPLLKYTTISFGVTALHELTMLVCGESIKERPEFAIEVLNYLNVKLEEFKKEDNVMYALYGTPAESLAGTQLKQFNEKYWPIKGVSDKEYFTNSFHMHVSEDINAFQKQDLEEKLFKKITGGHIQYVRVANPNNLEALKATIKRGLDKGFYQGINFDACTCEDCYTTGNDWTTCPNCGSKNVTVISRVCGYLGHAQVKGDTRMNDSKLAEISDRKSM